MYLPRDGFKLKCDVLHPCSSKIGPSMKGHHRSFSLESLQSCPIRMAAIYE
jgi:hypothetical protein